ncbi:MAG: hypothetical protein IKJ32_04275 [Clostridia bacterium]|nr:hypothetical protein [Clostridia bacterium]
MQTATLIINQETLRQTLRAEKEHWAKLKQYFNINHELIENIAGEQLFGIGCFAGLLSFINCGNVYKIEEIVNFINFERNSNVYMRAISKIDDVSKLNEKQLSVLVNYLIRREALVEHFVTALLTHIESLKA